MSTAPRRPAVGQTVAEVGFPSECALAAIIRKGDLLILHPETVLEASDEVLAVVHRDLASGV